MRIRLAILLLSLCLFPFAHADDAPAAAAEQANDVIKMPLAEGVSMDDAVESMKLRANILNMQLVGELPLYKQLEAMGQPARRTEIFQFCDPMTAQRMVEANIDFAAYLPCRIALVEDAEGQGWLVMINLDPLLEQASVDPELHAEAVQVRDALMEIIEAGVNGEI